MIPDKEQLTEFKLFSGLNSDEIDRVLDVSRKEEHDNDEIIFEDSRQDNDLFIILEGSVSVELAASSFNEETTKQIQLTTMRPGDVFGEIAFLETRHRSASVRSVGAATVLRVSGAGLYELFDEKKNIGFIMMKNLAGILAQRLIDTNFKLRDSGIWRF